METMRDTNAKSSLVEREGTVRWEIDELGKNLEVLVNAIKDLEQHLEPITRPTEPSDAYPKSVAPLLTEIAERIVVLSELVNEQTDKVNSLRARSAL